MERILQITLLYDFYGELLTEKQRSVYEMYYLNDLSLKEIGEEVNISRQAARDLLIRSQKLLEYYEKKLMLVEQYIARKKIADDMLSEINGLLCGEVSQNIIDRLNLIKERIENLLL